MEEANGKQHRDPKHRDNCAGFPPRHYVDTAGLTDEPELTAKCPACSLALLEKLIEEVQLRSERNDDEHDEPEGGHPVT